MTDWKPKTGDVVRSLVDKEEAVVTVTFSDGDFALHYSDGSEAMYIPSNSVMFMKIGERNIQSTQPEFDMKKLWDGTFDLYSRFNLDVSTHPPLKRLRYISEEVLELEIEVTKEVYAGGDVYDASQEAADVIGTVFGELQSLGITWEMFMEAAQAVYTKNSNKTLDTHHVLGGKITKRMV